MEQKVKIIFVAIIFSNIFALAEKSKAEIIFQDDFESYAEDWTCTSDCQTTCSNEGDYCKTSACSSWNSIWSAGYTNCAAIAGFGATWKMGSGRNGGNAIYSWKKKTGIVDGNGRYVLSQYASGFLQWLTGDQVKTEIYHRWYMKVPPADQYDKTDLIGFKFWRYHLRENGYSNPPEIYLNVQGSTFASGNMGIWLLNSEFYELCDISEFNDNNWHCHELRIKINTEGQSDGIMQYWLDGALKATHTDLLMDNCDGQGSIHDIGVGVGNTTEEQDWYQTEWSAIAFDDIIVSTDYSGLLSEQDVIAPLAPSGLAVN